MQVSSKTSLHRRPACVLPWHGGNGNHQVRIDFIFTTIIILIVRSKWGVLVFSWSAGIMYQIMLIHISFFLSFQLPIFSSTMFLLLLLSLPINPPGTPPSSPCPTFLWHTTMRQTPFSAKTPGSSDRSGLFSVAYRSILYDDANDKESWLLLVKS